MEPITANRAWINLLEYLLQAPTAPKSEAGGLGQTYRLNSEILGYNFEFDMNYPIITIPERKLNYGFMMKEALWILGGSDKLADLEPYTHLWSKFSDDGITLSGAYGPMVRSQLDYVTKVLTDDLYSRQAVISIWKPNPAPSKDIPCTLNMQFLVRNGKLNVIHQMRSSDAYIGLPYDLFVFTCVAELVRVLLDTRLKLGTMYFRTGSSHLYHENRDKAHGCIHTTEVYDKTKFKSHKYAGDLFDYLEVGVI